MIDPAKEALMETIAQRNLDGESMPRMANEIGIPRLLDEKTI